MVWEKAMSWLKHFLAKTDSFGLHDHHCHCEVVYFYIYVYSAVSLCMLMFPKVGWGLRWQRWYYNRREWDIDYLLYSLSFASLFPSLVTNEVCKMSYKCQGFQRASREHIHEGGSFCPFLNISIDILNGVNAPFITKLISILSTNLRDAFFDSSLAKLKSIWNTSKGASSAALKRHLSILKAQMHLTSFFPICLSSAWSNGLF